MRTCYQILFTLTLLIFISSNAVAQNRNSTNPFATDTAHIIHTDSGFYVLSFSRLVCKNYYALKQEFHPYQKAAASFANVTPTIINPIHKPKLLTIHGNISYDFFYRSRIDTPINQQNFQQHTERVYLDIMLKEKYPLKLNFTARQSNSPYFRDFIDVNFNFDKYTYNRNLKQQLLDKLKAQTPQYKFPDLATAEAALKKQQSALDKTKNWLDDPATLQKIIEEREKIYYQKIKAAQDSIHDLSKQEIAATPSVSLSTNSIKNNLTDSLNQVKENLTESIKSKADSIAAPFAEFYEKQKTAIDSLTNTVAKQKAKVDSIKREVQKDVAGIRQKIYKAANEKELRKLAADNGIVIDKKTKLEQQLSAIKTLSIGRSVLNYTELTAQNITVTGVNIEYNPSYYAAFAAGKIDYRFRDFYNRKAKQNNQYVALARFGFGDKDRKAIIFSYFTGKKSNNNYGYTDSANSTVNLMGYSIEAIYKKDENIFLSAEFAKSTKPIIGSSSANKQTGSLWKFSDQSNMGINIKAQTIIPETHTKLSGFYRKTGENFQSFSLFSYNTNQTAWLARADQSFHKDRITLTGMLRRNDFTNPFTDKTYKTSTVFKSVLLNVRLRKFPTISVGYYPSTQLYVVDKETIRESAYYILNGSASYSYIVKGLQMNSMAVFNKYTSEATDSGFVAYQGVNIYASQAIRFSKLQLQGGYAYIRQSQLIYSTIEAMGDYAFKNWLHISTGVKYNTIKNGASYWGESVQLRAEHKKWGGLQLQYEKSYLPTITQQLASVEIGRVGYYRRF
jgi:hypothetical protein